MKELCELLNSKQGVVNSKKLTPEQLEKFFVKTNKFFDQKQFEKYFIANYYTCISFPSHSGLWVHLGYCFRKGVGVKIHPDLAYQCALKAYQLEPDNVSALYNLGICYQKGIGVTASLEKALGCFRRVQLKHPRSPWVLYKLGNCYKALLDEGSFPKQIFYLYKKAVDNMPNHIGANYNLCCCYFDGLGTNKNPKLAIIHAQAVLKQKPSHIATLMRLALYFEEQNNVEQAKNYLNKVLTLEPNNRQALDHKEKLSFQKMKESSKELSKAHEAIVAATAIPSQKVSKIIIPVAQRAYPRSVNTKNSMAGVQMLHSRSSSLFKKFNP